MGHSHGMPPTSGHVLSTRAAQLGQEGSSERQPAWSEGYPTSDSQMEQRKGSSAAIPMHKVSTEIKRIP